MGQHRPDYAHRCIRAREYTYERTYKILEEAQQKEACVRIGNDEQDVLWILARGWLACQSIRLAAQVSTQPPTDSETTAYSQSSDCRGAWGLGEGQRVRSKKARLQSRDKAHCWRLAMMSLRGPPWLSLDRISAIARAGHQLLSRCISRPVCIHFPLVCFPSNARSALLYLALFIF